MKKLYLLTGLGATDYMFKNLVFPPNVKPVYLPWFDNDPGDTFSDFARRIIERYQMEEGNIILGLSFGGIIASEIHKLLPQKRIFLISSISHVGQLPVLYRLPGMTKAAEGFVKRKKSLPATAIAWPFQPMDDEDYPEIERIVHDISEQHTLWVIRNALNWDQSKPLGNIFHIHGTADRIFPDGRIRPDVKIEGGGHLMILNRSAEINEILKKELEGE